MKNFLFTFIYTILTIVLLRAINKYIFELSEFFVGWVSCTIFYVSYYLLEKKDEEAKEKEEEKEL